MKVVQNAGKYGGKSPVEHWLSVIASRQAIAAYRRLHQRMKRVLFRAEMVAKMRDDGEQDDLDLESLAKEAHQVVTSFLGSLDAETAEAIIRNKVEGIIFEAWAKRPGKAGKARLRLRVSRAYRKMRQKVPSDLRRSLVHMYQGGDWEYAKKQSKKPP